MIEDMSHNKALLYSVCKVFFLFDMLIKMVFYIY